MQKKCTFSYGFSKPVLMLIILIFFIHPLMKHLS